MSLTGSISRAPLGLGDLLIGGNGTYAFPTSTPPDPGDTTPRLSLVTSLYVTGAVDVGSDVDELSEISARVQVRAPDQAALQVAIDALAAAVRQRSFTFTFQVAGTSYSYACLRGRHSMGFTAALAFTRLAVVVLTIPRQPGRL